MAVLTSAASSSRAPGNLFVLYVSLFYIKPYFVVVEKTNTDAYTKCFTA